MQLWVVGLDLGLLPFTLIIVLSFMKVKLQLVAYFVFLHLFLWMTTLTNHKQTCMVGQSMLFINMVGLT